MSSSLATVSYIGAIILFILSLGGLSNQETARRGNLYGMVGMALAVLATVFGPQVSGAGIPWLIGAMLMRFGGVTALGCTVGQGLSGLSTLAIGSFIAVAGIVGGSVAMLKYTLWREERS